MQNKADGSVASTKKFWFIVNDVEIDFRDCRRVKLEQTGYSSIENPQNRQILNSKTMKLAFLIDANQIMEKITQIQSDLTQQVFYRLMLVSIGLALVLTVPTVLRLRRLSKILTSKVVYLLETLEAILNEQSIKWSRGDQALQLNLTFKPACREINELHVTFNSVQRTLLSAMVSFQDNMSDEGLA